MSSFNVIRRHWISLACVSLWLWLVGFLFSAVDKWGLYTWAGLACGLSIWGWCPIWIPTLGTALRPCACASAPPLHESHYRGSLEEN